MVVLYVGTYTDRHGHVKSETLGDGVHMVSYDVETGSMKCAGSFHMTDSPSYLCRHSQDPNLIYAAQEVEVGKISALRIRDSGGLELINTVSSDGSFPCHIAVTRDGGAVTYANYGSGSIGVRSLDGDGYVSEVGKVFCHEGETGPCKDRQEAPHAHCAHVSPRDDVVYACDLGLDSIFAYAYQNGTLGSPEKVASAGAQGAGPRHTVVHPSLPVAYVANELNSTLSWYKMDIGAWKLEGTVSTLPQGYENPENNVAHIAIDSNGKNLYVSNRGHDSIASFSLDLASGMATSTGHCSSGGKTPRHFALSPDERFVIVANQDTSNIVLLSRNDLDGTLTPCEGGVSIGSPVCLLF